MTLSINTNTAAMAALQSLNQTTSDLNKTENAVSTGKTVNDASDNPAIYAIAQTATSQISALSGVSTGLQFASSALSTATSGASAISDILSSLSTSVTTAANNGVNADTLNSQLSSSLKQIDVNASTATFQGVNLLAGATGNGVNYTNLSAAQDINGNLFTQQGANATATGLGLQGLSSTMSGASLNVGSTSYISSDNGSAAQASVLSMQNLAAASGSGTASNPAVSTSFVMDDQSSSGLASTKTLSSLLSKAVDSALGTSGSNVQVAANGALSSSAIKSSSTSSNGTTTYTLTNGNTISAQADASGNVSYDVSTAKDANGNTTASSHIVDVNTSASASETGSQKSTDQTSTLMQAMSNAGFGVARANDGTLTIAGGNLSASSVSLSAPTQAAFSTVGATLTNASVLTVQNDAAANKSASSSTPAVSNQFILDDHQSTTVSGGMNSTSTLSSSIATAAGITKAANMVVNADGTLTDTTDISSTSTANGVTTYSLKSGNSITAQKDASGNTVYSVKTTSATTNIIDVNTSSSANMPTATAPEKSAQTAAQAATLATAMGNAGIATSLNSDGTYSAALTNGLSQISWDSTTASTAEATTTQAPAITLNTASATLASGSTLTFQNASATLKNSSSSNPAVTTQFVLDSDPKTQTDTMKALDAVSGSTDLTLTSGALTSAGGSISGTSTSGGVTTYNLTNGNTITSQTDNSGNVTYSVSSGTGTTNIIDVNIGSSTDQSTINQSLNNAMNNAGFVNTANSSGTTIAANSNAITAEWDTKTTGATATSTYNTNQSLNSTVTSGTNVVQLAVNAAITKMSQISSSLGVGSNTITQLQTSTSNLSSSLTTGVGALTDADLAAESAKLTSLQTKQQLAIQSLSIANSQSSTLLSLFRG